MANPIIHTFFDSPDPNATPLNLTQLYQLSNLLVHSEFVGDYIPYVLKSGTPDTDDQDKVWIEKDTQGRPVAIKVFWNGDWRRVYNGMMGEIRGYTGNPGTDFDSTGWGIAKGEYDGWHLCNGNDGAPDYSDHFLIGAHMNNEDHSGYVDNEWVTWINKDAGAHTGGETEFTLDETNTFQPSGAIGELKVGMYEITGALLHDNETKWGAPSVSDEDKNKILSIQSTGKPDPDPVSIIPPFIALGWVIFLGYRT